MLVKLANGDWIDPSQVVSIKVTTEPAGWGGWSTAPKTVPQLLIQMRTGIFHGVSFKTTEEAERTRDEIAAVVNAPLVVDNDSQRKQKWAAYREAARSLAEEAERYRLRAACEGMTKIARDILANDDPDSDKGLAAQALLDALAPKP
jgi:hypothetical protein